jgi:hypothetical protein
VPMLVLSNSSQQDGHLKEGAITVLPWNNRTRAAISVPRHDSLKQLKGRGGTSPFLPRDGFSEGLLCQFRIQNEDEHRDADRLSVGSAMLRI